MRVVSLLPSATETLGLLLGSRLERAGVTLIGRSHECDHPASVLSLPALTAQRTSYATAGAAGVDAQVSAALANGESLYSLDVGLLTRLAPDLILTQDLCDVCSIDLGAVRAAAAAMPTPPEVLSLNPNSFEDILDDVLRVGRAIGLARDAEAHVAALRERMDAAGAHANPYAQARRAVFLEWTDPLFVGGHWTPQLIERAGAAHPLNAAPDGSTGGIRPAPKSRRVNPHDVAAIQPDAVIICPCGLSLDQARDEARRLRAQRWFADLPAARAEMVAVVDGAQMFNRPGPRLVDAFEWLVGWLHDRPDVIPPGFPWEPA